MNKNSIKFFGVLLVIVLVVAGGYFIWDRFLRFDPEKYYTELEQKYVEAMTNDTYGGKTPQETLDMFVEALRAEDVELASKYFALDDNLSREKWIESLSDIKNRELLTKMATDIQNEAKPFGDANEEKFSYALFNSDGIVEVLITLHFNQYSGVWKIENL